MATLRIEDLKRRRNEWLSDGINLVMLDADDCMHSVSPVYADLFDKRWAVGWAFLDSPYGVPHVSNTLFASQQAAKDWVETYFSEPFHWFEAA